MCRHCLCEGCWTLPNWPSAWLRSLAEYVLFLFLSLFLLLFLFVRSFLAQVLCLRICKSQRKTMLEHKLNKCEIFYRYVCQPVCPYICVCVCVCWAACTKKQITFHRLVRAEQLILLCVLSLYRSRYTYLPLPFSVFVSRSLTHNNHVLMTGNCLERRRLAGHFAPIATRRL